MDSPFVEEETVVLLVVHLTQHSLLVSCVALGEFSSPRWFQCADGLAIHIVCYIVDWWLIYIWNC
jgi:hypothetical protein